jgi:transposase
MEKIAVDTILGIDVSKADAALIARYCNAMKPRLWNPPSPSQRHLQRLGRRRVASDEMRVQEINRLKGPGVDEVRPSIEKTIAFLEAEIARVGAEIQRLSAIVTG